MTLSVESRPTELSMTVLMTPDMANFAGNVHGGALLRLLDQVAYTCASKYAQSYVVTLSVDRVLFREVVYVANWSPSTPRSTTSAVRRWRWASG